MALGTSVVVTVIPSDSQTQFLPLYGQLIPLEIFRPLFPRIASISATGSQDNVLASVNLFIHPSIHPSI